jgi:sulfatase maturation enzyme AslB (radical SAM superfamily)
MTNNSYDKPMVEFILWANCNNSCSFCWQHKRANKNTLLDQDQKNDAASQAIHYINSPKFKRGSDVLIVGGEMYGQPSPIDELFIHVKDRVKDGTIRYFYTNTNLIYKDLHDVSKLITIFLSEGIIDRLKFTTSYDVYGRYKNKDDEELFKENLEVLTYSFPELRVTVNMILTKQLCEKILSREFSVKNFCDKYKVQVNLLPHVVLEEHMRASKVEVFNTLLLVNDEMGNNFLNKYIDNYNLEQEKIIFEYHREKGYVECEAPAAECGHNSNFRRVFDDKSCFVCEISKLAKL